MYVQAYEQDDTITIVLFHTQAPVICALELCSLGSSEGKCLANA
jgi:hypothetical protein